MTAEEDFLWQTEAAFRALCAQEPLSSEEAENVDFLDATARASRLCYEHSQKYYLLCKKQGFRVEACAWSLAAFQELWQKAAAAVRDFSCSYYYLLRRRRVYHDIRNDNYSSFCPAELLYSLYLKCLLNRHHGAPWAPGAAFEGLCQQHIPYVRAKGRLLLRSTRPLSDFSLRLLMECLNQLEYRWLHLPHSLELESYIEALELRLAELLSEPQPELLHDVPCFRRPLQLLQLQDGSSLQFYSFNEELLTRVTNIGLCFQRALDTLYSIPLGSRGELQLLLPGLQEERLQALLELLEKKFREVASSAAQLDDMDNIFPSNYVALSCRPFEVVSYVSKAASRRLLKSVRLRAEPTEVLIDQRERSAYNKIIEQSHMGLLKALDVSPEVSPFARPLAVLCLTSRILFGRSMVNFSQNYVYYRSFIHNTFHPEYSNLGQIMNDPYPLLLQSFNAFYLFYRGWQYPLRSTLHGVVCWLYLVARDLGCSAQGKDLDAAYRELLGPHWRTAFGLEEEQQEGGLLHVGRSIISPAPEGPQPEEVAFPF